MALVPYLWVDRRFKTFSRTNCASVRVIESISTVFLVLSVSLALVACGGGSSDTVTDTQPDESDNGGSEPRMLLKLSAPASVNLSVNTVSDQTVVAAGESQSQNIQSSVSVAVSLTKNEDEFRLNAIPELNSLLPEDLELSDIPLFKVKDTLNLQGQKTQFEPERDIYDVLTLDALSLPAFNLSVPEFEVGNGASWTERNSFDLLNSTSLTTVNAISDSAVSVTKVIDVGTDSEERYTVSGTMDATYALPSLLMTSADISLSVRFEDELYINGIRQSVVDTRSYTQTIREIAQ